MPATIELRTRDIQVPLNVPFLGHPQHGYIIHTTSNGIKHIIRGGPSNDDMLRGNLVVDYTKYNNDIQGLAKSDYITDPSKYRTVTLYSGDDITASNYVGKIWEYGQKINAKSHDYKLPLCDALGFGEYNKCSQGNSNSFVKKSIEFSGLTYRQPAGIDGNSVWMPGINSDIRDTLLDHIQGHGGKYADITAQQAREIYERYITKRAELVKNFANTANDAIISYKMNASKDKALIERLTTEYKEWQNLEITKMQNQCSLTVDSRTQTMQTFQNNKATLLQQINNVMKTITGDIDISNTPREVSARISELKVNVMGELDAYKASLLDEYGLKYESFS